MSEIGPSEAIVSVAGVPSVATGGFAEVGKSTFSGLETPEGPKGPVSFTNSTDLFAETLSLETLRHSPPEGPIGGEVFGQTEILAQAPINPGVSKPSTEVNIFSYTKPLSIAQPLNEGPVSKDSLMDTITIAQHKPDPEPLFEAEPQTEITVGAAVQEYFKTHEAPSSEVNPQTFNQNIEDLRYNDPLTYKQLKSDLESVDKILDLVDEADINKQTAASISNSAIETAVKRSGLIQEAIQESVQGSEAEREPDVEVSDLTDGQRTQINEQTEVAHAGVEIDIETNEPPSFPQDNKEQTLVRDEEANNVRIEDRQKALQQAAEDSINPVTGKLKGKDVLKKVVTKDDEQSGLAKSAGVDDGSIPEADKVIAQSEFRSVEETESVIFEAVRQNSGVKDGNNGKVATEEEVKRVLKGKPSAGSINQTLPIAA